MSDGPPRLCVMLSGGGRTLRNLAEKIDAGALDARIVLVVASRECLGAQRARDLGVETVVAPGDLAAGELERLAIEARCDWVVLAGYLRRVDIPPSLAGRVVNIHPALLPRFGGRGMYGERVHRAVLDAGEEESGCTVHLCDGAYDTGPVILQKRCDVRPDDTPESLAERVFALEQEAYPEALTRLFQRAQQEAPERTP